jgi:hypothetical protein
MQLALRAKEQKIQKWDRSYEVAIKVLRSDFLPDLAAFKAGASNPFSQV